MLRVALHGPQGQMLGYMDIVNVGTGDATTGQYAVALLDGGLHALRHAEVHDYPRQLGPWPLVQHALKALHPEAPCDHTAVLEAAMAVVRRWRMVAGYQVTQPVSLLVTLNAMTLLVERLATVIAASVPHQEEEPHAQ